jgi:heat shock protein HtpX
MNVYQQISSNNRQTFFILLLFCVVVVLIMFIASMVAGDPEVFPVLSGGALIIVLIWTLFSYFFGSKMITSFVGAKPVKRKDHFELYNLVQNLAITAGLPNPEVYVIKDESLNAFATGRNPKHGIVAVTTGLLDKLNKRELEAVLAHEMGHIANYDIRLQLILITVVGAIAMLGEVMMRVRGKKAGGIILAGLFIYIIGVPLLRLVSLGLSRNREYLADATGALYTRNPEALADALEKISEDSRVESADRMNSAAHLFIANPKKEPDTSSTKKVHEQSFFTKLFSTHPPVFERIKRLKGKA